MEVLLENIICVFTLIEGKIYLLTKNKDLIKIKCDDDINIVNEKYIKDNININNLDLKQYYVFSNKKDNKLNISVLFMDIVNYNQINNPNEFELFNVYDLKDNKYINKAISFIRKELVLNSVIKKVYDEEFSLPEIQKLYEELLDKKYDRRNFRKRLINLDVVEPLEKMSSNKNGRPAKLYKFKNIKEDKILF